MESMENKQDWFAEWFDTKYYHTLYKNRDDSEAEQFIKNLVDDFKITDKDYCLDLACGKGRHAKFLHSITNAKVLGVDLSPQSILGAKTFENEKLNFAVQDMREVIANEKFDFIFNLFTSFGYFDSNSENLKVLESIFLMLEKDGLLLIDFMNTNKVVENLVEKEVKRVDGITFNITRKFDGEHIVKNIQFSDESKNFDYSERVQGLMLTDFQTLLKEANFEIISTFGDFDLSEFDEKTSDRLIIKARKK